MIACHFPKEKEGNPFFTEYQTPHGTPPFHLIRTEHYKPAFLEGIRQQAAEIDSIVNNPDEPTFDNTIAALDYSGNLLDKVNGVFFNLTSAETNDTLQELALEISPLLTEHADNISLNADLFHRIRQVYDNRETAHLTREQERLLEKQYKSFVRSGALLKDQEKEKLKSINKELAELSLRFSNHVLAETNAFKLIIDNDSTLAGLPDWVKAAAAETAASQGESGKWIFTLHKPSLIPFLQYSANRPLREKMYKAYISRGDNDNQNDNKQIINRTVNLRTQKAHLMGYRSYADFMLDDRMAKNSANVTVLIDRVWEKAIAKAKIEATGLQKIIDNEGGDFRLAPWDWWYYTEKSRKDKFDLDEEQIKPYFQLDNVRDGAFMVANRLWGIDFEELTDIPVYHTDVKVYEVKDSDGKQLGILYLDYFPRPGKEAGAWMNNYREQYVQNGVETRPIICNVANFTQPTANTPSLLNIDEVQTLFHEFGHALHGLLTQCTYPGVSGTNVTQDFVELPSQIMEHWATDPEVLKLYARHYQTGDTISDGLIEKLKKSATFNQGFATIEFVAAAILDMKWHELETEKEINVRSFEKDALKQAGLIPEIGVRYRSPYFNHIFSGGYAVGYYSYLWAEVLDADAFDAFAEHGIFDPETARAYRENILEKGGSEEPMTLYTRFRGAEPNPNSLLKNRGLLD